MIKKKPGVIFLVKLQRFSLNCYDLTVRLQLIFEVFIKFNNYHLQRNFLVEFFHLVSYHAFKGCLQFLQNPHILKSYQVSLNLHDQ